MAEEHSSSFFLLPSVPRRVWPFLRQFVALADAFPVVRVPVLPAGPFALQPAELFPRRLAVVERPVASAVPPVVCAPAPAAGLFGYQPVEPSLLRRSAAVVEGPVVSAARVPALPPEISGLATIRRP